MLPSLKCHRGIIKGLDWASLLVKHKVFTKELAVLNVKHQLINEQVVAIRECIACIDEEVDKLDEE